MDSLRRKRYRVLGTAAELGDAPLLLSSDQAWKKCGEVAKIAKEVICKLWAVCDMLGEFGARIA